MTAQFRRGCMTVQLWLLGQQWRQQMPCVTAAVKWPSIGVGDGTMLRGQLYIYCTGNIFCGELVLVYKVAFPLWSMLIKESVAGEQFQFRSVQDGTYMLVKTHCTSSSLSVSRKFLQCCHLNSSNACLIDDDPFLSFNGKYDRLFRSDLAVQWLVHKQRCPEMTLCGWQDFKIRSQTTDLCHLPAERHLSLLQHFARTLGQFSKVLCCK